MLHHSQQGRHKEGSSGHRQVDPGEVSASTSTGDDTHVIAPLDDVVVRSRLELMSPASHNLLFIMTQITSITNPRS